MKGLPPTRKPSCDRLRRASADKILIPAKGFKIIDCGLAQALGEDILRAAALREINVVSA